MRKCVAGLLFIGIFSARSSIATEPADASPDEFFDLSLAELTRITVVTATKKPQPIAQAPATIRVITAQQIKQRGYVTLYDALKDLPGIDILNVQGAFPQIITFRGSYGDENRRLQLLVDGVEETSINGSFELAGPAFTLDHVERIEVIWGPASALYGANAFSGIINIITRQGADHEGVTYSRGQGSFNTQVDQFYANHSLGELHANVSVSRLQTDGPVYRNRHPQFSDAYVDDAVHLGVRIGGHHSSLDWTVSGRLYDNPMGDGVFGNSPTAALGLPPASAENPGTGGWLNFNVDADPASRWNAYFSTLYGQLDYQFNSQTSVQFKASYRNNGVDDGSYSILQAGDHFYRFNVAFESRQQAYQWQIAHERDDLSTLHLGVSYSDSDMEDGYRRTIVDSQISTIDGLPIRNWYGSLAPRRAVNVYNHSIYSQYQFDVDASRRYRMTVGGRYDRNSLYGSNFSPKLGLVSRLNESVTYKLLYGRAYRAPSVFELFSSSPVRRANPALEPETVDTLEAGLYFTTEDRLIKVNTFYNQLDKVIVDGVVVGDGQTQIQNTGKAGILGGEVEWDEAISAQWRLSFNYSYQDARQNNGDGYFTVANIARHKANLGIDWSLGNGYHLHWMTNWVGRRKTVATNPLDSVPSYAASHLALQTGSFLDGHLNVHLRVNNVFNERYVDPGHRSANGIQYSPVSEQPGRHVLVQLRVDW